jgi:hypothetical protein
MKESNKNIILSVYYYGIQPLRKFYCTAWMQNVVVPFFYKTAGI